MIWGPRNRQNSVTNWRLVTCFGLKMCFSKIQILICNLRFARFTDASGEAVYTNAPSWNLFFSFFDFLTKIGKCNQFISELKDLLPSKIAFKSSFFVQS